MENQQFNSAPMAPYVESYIKAFDELSAGPTIRHQLALVDVPSYRAQWEQMRKDVCDTIRYIGTLPDSDESHIRGVFLSATIAPFTSKTTSHKDVYEKDINEARDRDLNFLKCITQDILERGRSLAQTHPNQVVEVQKDVQPNHFIVFNPKEKAPWITRNWSKLREKLNSKPAETVTQNDIDRKAMLLSARFGLDGVSIQDEKAFSLSERSEKFDLAEKNLIEACRRIGIQEDQFGLQRNISLMLESLKSQVISNRSGFQQSINGSENILMGFRPDSVGCEQTIVHEFTHSIDRHLAIKALLKMNVPLENISEVYFSDLPAHIQSVLPEAKEGIDQIFGVATNKASPGAIGTLKAKAVLRLSDKFMDEVLTALDEMSMTPKDRVDLRNALNSDNDSFLNSVAKEVMTSPIKHAISKSIHQKTGEEIEVHPFIRKLKELTTELPVPFLQKCFGKVVSELASVAAVNHPLSQNSQPGKMLIDSISKDMASSDFKGNRLYQYWSKNTELFARMIGRPFDTSAYAVYPGSFSHHLIEPIAAKQEEALNDGWRKILLCASLKLSGGPSLSQGKEFKAAGRDPDETTRKTAELARRALLGIDSSKSLSYHRTPI